MDEIKYNFFPQGLALGENFCNRLEEQKHLTANIMSARPTLVISPRRYGKTSLVHNVLLKLKIAYASIDLYSELNEQEVQNSILSGIGDILYAIESKPKKTLKYITDFFSDLNVSFSFINSQIKVEFSKSRKPPAKVILFALKRLDENLNKKNKNAVIFLDEFQRLTQISDSTTIEGALRHIAQSSKNISFIFSGSNRSLLNQMFDDRTKPLYKLCDRIALNRILPKHYMPFIQHLAKKRWGITLDNETIEMIFYLTEYHPYYLNVLCHRLWLRDKSPDAKLVLQIWHQYTLEEKSNVIAEIELLSKNQINLLIAIAKYGDEILPMSKEFISLTKFSLSSISQAINVLEKKDFLYINAEKKYCILDPLIKFIFKNI